MKRKILFIDRDGTIIEEPPDEQIDRYDKLALIPGVIPALLEARRLGYELVMVTNQDGLGTASFPREDFDGPHKLMMQVLESQGVSFAEVLIDESFEGDNSPNRKPGIGMVLGYLKSGDLDLERSAVIGDRETDLKLAENMGIRGIRIGPGGLSWTEIARDLREQPRTARLERNTKETRITVTVDLDRTSPVSIDTGIGFFDHMLEQLAAHGGIALELQCRGDLHVDAHHTVEDCALALGQALGQAIGDKIGIGRYGFVVPMDEALAQAALDLSGRPLFRFRGEFTREEVGGLPCEMVPHFFRSLADAMRATIHLEVDGDNAHHMIEGCFKALGRCLRQAVARTDGGLPSTKGVL